MDFAGSIPAAYDRYLGHLLFQPFAEDLAARLAAEPAARALELAAGTDAHNQTLSTARARTVAAALKKDLPRWPQTVNGKGSRPRRPAPRPPRSTFPASSASPTFP